MSVVDDFSLFLTNVFGAQVLERFFQLFDISVCSSFDPDQNAATPQSGFVNLSPIFRDTSTNQRADYSAGGNASGVEAAALRDSGLRMGSNVARAHVTHRAVAVEYVAPEEVLGLEPVGSEK